MIYTLDGISSSDHTNRPQTSSRDVYFFEMHANGAPNQDRSHSCLERGRFLDLGLPFQIEERFWTSFKFKPVFASSAKSERGLSQSTLLCRRSAKMCVCVCVRACVRACARMFVCQKEKKVPDEWQARQAIPAILQVTSSKHNEKKITTRVRHPFHQSITAILT